MKKFLAFTLAETLIVMGIIGIVSALTLPNLNSSTGDKEKVAKVKKIYQNLEDALGRAQAVYGPYAEWFGNDNSIQAQTTRFSDRLTEFMKTSKNCGWVRGSNGSCWSNTDTKYLNGTTYLNIDQNNFYKFTLADGTAIATVITANTGMEIYIDIDGPNKGKNTFGHDIFWFRVELNAPYVLPLTTNTMDGYVNGGHCASYWVTQFDNMDYLKANTSGKCKDSNTTLNILANPPIVSCK